MPETTVLVVGAGFGQLPAVHAARALGWHTVVVDRDRHAPAMAAADAAHVVDVIDTEAVVAVARRERVNGAITLQSDVGVPSVGAVNSALGTRGVDLATARTCSRKDLARQRWAERNVPQPTFAILTAAEQGAAEAALDITGLPCIVKPADSSGSRGVTKVSERSELRPALAHAFSTSHAGVVVIEQYVTGREIGAQTFSRDGRCELVLLHNDQVSAPPYMIPVGHSYPFTADGADVASIEASVAAAVEALGIGEGPANVDLVLTDDGVPMLLEIGARIGATCLPELTSIHTGLDWVATALRHATGEQVDLRPRRAQACAALILTAPDDGIVARIDRAHWLDHDDSIVEIELNVAPGDRVSRLRKGTDRIGKVVTIAHDTASAERLAERAAAAVAVTLQ